MTATLYSRPMTDTPDGLLLSVSEVADALNLTTDQVRALIYNRRLRGKKVPIKPGAVAAEWRVDPAEVERYRRDHVGTAARSKDDLTVGQAATRLGKSVKAVRDLLYAGRLTGWKDESDRNWRIPREEVERYIAAPQTRIARHPMFKEGDKYAERCRYEGRPAEAPAAVTAAIVERNLAILRWRERGETVDAIAAAFHLHRVTASNIIRDTRRKRDQK